MKKWYGYACTIDIEGKRKGEITYESWFVKGEDGKLYDTKRGCLNADSWEHKCESIAACNDENMKHGGDYLWWCVEIEIDEE